MSDVQNELIDVLKKHRDDALAAEGITPEVLECVILEIEFSPVIARSGGQYESAVRVKPYGFFPDGVLPVRFDVCGDVVDRDELKIMRARYLLARGKRFGPAMARFKDDRQ